MISSHVLTSARRVVSETSRRSSRRWMPSTSPCYCSSQEAVATQNQSRHGLTQETASRCFVSTSTKLSNDATRPSRLLAWISTYSFSKPRPLLQSPYSSNLHIRISPLLRQAIYSHCSFWKILFRQLSQLLLQLEISVLVRIWSLSCRR